MKAKSLTVIMLLLVTFMSIQCSKDDGSSGGSGIGSGKGTFTFKGKTYTGTCSVIPQSTDISSGNYPGFQWSMDIHADSGEFLTMGMFPQNNKGTFGLSNGEMNGYNNRNGVIGLGGSELYTLKYGKIKKISKTKFSIEGVAFADLSEVEIPFSAEGTIMDLTDGFNISDKSPFPTGKGMVSFYTNMPLSNEKLTIYLSNGSSLINHIGEITYANDPDYQCGESECFYFSVPGTYSYKVYNKNWIEVSSGSYNVSANTCNPVQIGL